MQTTNSLLARKWICKISHVECSIFHWELSLVDFLYDRTFLWGEGGEEAVKKDEIGVMGGY